MRDTNYHRDFAAFEIAQALEHTSRALAGIRGLRNFLETRHLVIDGFTACSDHQHVVVVDHATFSSDLIMRQFKFFDGIHKKLDTGFKQAGLLPNDIVHSHFPEGNIQQTGLVPVLISSRQHGDLDLPFSHFPGESPCHVIGSDSAAHAPADK